MKNPNYSSCNYISLMRVIFKLLLVLALLPLAIACDQKEGGKPENSVPLGKIIYDTNIINPNPEDEWVTEFLSKFKRDELIEIIFDGIYSGRIKPVDYFSNNKLSVEDIRNLEESEEFSRDRIAQIKFDEKWEWDENSMSLKKEVKSLTLAYEVYNNIGELRGYKPAFKIVFRGQK